MSLRRDGIHDARVLAAMERVPRDMFVAETYKHLAYEDQSLPLISGQTISQPLVVAKMTQELGLNPESRVLEVGTGSGYQAAVLAHLCRRVASIERVKDLHKIAKQRLAALDLYNVDLRLGDGFRGWPEAAPFDAIILTCAPEALPDDLFDQLSIGGRLVAPIGDQRDRQTLKVYRKLDASRVSVSKLGSVRFVPMLSGVS